MNEELKPCPVCGRTDLAHPAHTDRCWQIIELWKERDALQASVNKLEANLQLAKELLGRLSQWDMLNTYYDNRPATADGPYWKREIDEVLQKLGE